MATGRRLGARVCRVSVHAGALDVAGRVTGDLGGSVYLATCDGPHDIDSSGGFFFRAPAVSCRVRVMAKRSGRIGWTEAHVDVAAGGELDLIAPTDGELRAYTDEEIAHTERLLRALCGPDCERTGAIRDLEDELREARRVRDAEGVP